MILIDRPFQENLHHTSNKVYAGINWRIRAKIKEDYLWWFKTLGKLKKPDNLLKPFKVTFAFEFVKRPYDCDNCSFMGKMILDCIIANKIIPDDSPRYVEEVRYKSKKGTSNHLMVKIL